MRTNFDRKAKIILYIKVNLSLTMDQEAFSIINTE